MDNGSENGDQDRARDNSCLDSSSTLAMRGNECDHDHDHDMGGTGRA